MKKSSFKSQQHALQCAHDTCSSFRRAPPALTQVFCQGSKRLRVSEPKTHLKRPVELVLDL